MRNRRHKNDHPAQQHGRAAGPRSAGAGRPEPLQRPSSDNATEWAGHGLAATACHGSVPLRALRYSHRIALP